MNLVFFQQFFILFAFIFLSSGIVYASESSFRMSGFGTLGYLADHDPHLAPSRELSYRPDEAYQTASSWKPDSRLGFQFEYALDPDFDLVSQWVWRDKFRATPENSVELAYIEGRLPPDLKFRAGRINYDAFLMADYRNVGYAYPWVRPPVEFYGWVPIFSIDGVDAAVSMPLSEGQLRFKAQLGRTKLPLPVGQGYDFVADSIAGGSALYQTQNWRLKLAHSRIKVASDVPALAPLQAGLKQLAQANLPGISSEAGDRLSDAGFKGAAITYTTAGLSYDDGLWYGQMELGRSTTTRSMIPHGSMGYLSMGRRFGSFTPFVGYGRFRADDSPRVAQNNWGPFNGPVRDQAIFFINSPRIDQDSVSLGMRWDFHSQAALKLQWDRTHIRPWGYGMWFRNSEITYSHRRVDLLTATLDFVF